MTNASVESVDTTGEGVKANVKQRKEISRLKLISYCLLLVLLPILKISDLKK